MGPIKRSASRTRERGGIQPMLAEEGAGAEEAEDVAARDSILQSKRRMHIQMTKKSTPSGRVNAAATNKSGARARPRSETLGASARSKPAVTKNVNIPVSKPAVHHNANAEQPATSAAVHIDAGPHRPSSDFAN